MVTPWDEKTRPDQKATEPRVATPQLFHVQGQKGKDEAETGHREDLHGKQQI